MKQTLIFDVKRYAINDGPGVRITIFLKGCSMTCDWCHNPESQSAYTQKMYSEQKCIGCQECVKACLQNACTLTANGIITDSQACILCGTCAEVCPAKATEMSGEEMSVERIMEMIKKETIFMDQSEGGVTFSGGEPLLHHEFLLELLKECGKEGIHRCVDTTGFATTEVLMKIARNTEYFLYDLKMMDSVKHKQYTGVPNEVILKNLKLLAASGAEINIRIPLIHGVNDDEENIQQSAAFIASLKGEKKQVNILPYHNIASTKYKKLGQMYNPGIMAQPDEDRQQYVLDVFKSYGLRAMVGG
jgi:pyruvate formate lyase activating enzyme